MSKQRLATVLARVFGIGNLPVSPGTFGSLPGLVVGYLIHTLIPHPVGIAVALMLLVGFAYWVIDVYEKALGVHDDQRIVIDEVAGQAIAVAFVAPTALTYFLGFALFRLFDITKPPPIGTIDEKIPGAAGTLFDDIVAGIVAGALLYGAIILLKRFGYSGFLGNS